MHLRLSVCGQKYIQSHFVFLFICSSTYDLSALHLFVLEHQEYQLVLGTQVDQGSQDLQQVPDLHLLLDAPGGLQVQCIQGHHHPDNHK